MHDHTTEEQARENREKDLATSSDWTSHRVAGQVHPGRRHEAEDRSRNSDDVGTTCPGTDPRAVSD